MQLSETEDWRLKGLMREWVTEDDWGTEPSCIIYRPTGGKKGLMDYFWEGGGREITWILEGPEGDRSSQQSTKGGILKTDCQWERIIRILQSPMGGSGTFYWDTFVAFARSLKLDESLTLDSPAAKVVAGSFASSTSKVLKVETSPSSSKASISWGNDYNSLMHSPRWMTAIFFFKINNDFPMFFLREILTSDYHVQVSRRPLLPKSTRHRLGKEP